MANMFRPRKKRQTPRWKVRESPSQPYKLSAKHRPKSRRSSISPGAGWLSDSPHRGRRYFK